MLKGIYVTNDSGKETKRAMETLKGIRIKHCQITPCSPWENGEIDLFFLCLKREIFRKFEVGDFERVKELVTEYVRFYDTERIHRGIEYKTPRN